MRRLTLSGYLESYVRYLSGEDTRSLSRLVELLPREPRLAEPLLLWATTTGRTERLAGLLAGNPRLLKDLRELAPLADAGLLQEALASEDPRLAPEYAKAWRSYVVRRDASLRDADLKLEARDRVLALEKQRRVSRYRMAKDLALNPGNLHAFLTQGDPSKLALDKAYRLVDYLEAA